MLHAAVQWPRHLRRSNSVLCVFMHGFCVMVLRLFTLLGEKERQDTMFKSASAIRQRAVIVTALSYTSCHGA